jgi:hypothetical protein
MDQGGAAADNGLRQLAIRLQDPFFRKAFAADPEGALAQAGIAPEAIPSDILETLLELSPKELAALARVRKVLEAGDVPHDVRAEMV